ncbi:ABC transporter ATP-binding protein [Kaistia algarum]|uniref:ABC transporter ATP-binding protein n=1 Tax=Kaistia algarum TaxID=2083279 RepID=UPI000CE8A327|nr:ABC transporter ATP-binding protein [Kaistia algarum]MCX5514411.1 ABC transporter ATP-binding protein [Kaistia algarum]PPE79151.1 ABC transporter ATP-binding protein [Kaistia algarum]
MTNLLSVRNLDAFYGDFQALFGVDLEVEAGEVVALVGANGAGKSTFLASVTGLLPTRPGSILLRGSNIAGEPAFRIARSGVAMSPEGRRLFASLSVEENLRLGATGGRRGPWSLETVQALFPILKEKRRQGASELSGGQQQAVAIGRALMANPELLLLDEVSLGLAPVVVRDIYESLPAIRAAGTAVIVVEQDIGRATEISDRLYCLQEGRVNLAGRSKNLTRDQIGAAYFGRTRSAA